MRGTERPCDWMTTDLLRDWTDPDTAMEVVGRSLGIFDDRVSNPRSVLSTDSPLRSTLFAVLLTLVEGGALEKRHCGGGRYAFRWCDDLATAATSFEEAAPKPTLDVDSSDPEQAQQAEQADQMRWWSLGARIAPLLLPASSAMLAILLFLHLRHSFALLVALTFFGVAGILRRIPLAGFWTLAVVIAGLLLRFS